ncbi:MAG TPA: tRNA pseudouridine(38-40) synthase TruA [Gammaproteobacteria bacterium]|jgi:tRNA pseudouridine38-40 synthase|nr:tRNA pseudouridine(38-40) synthase TruA [Gammaproteobacteria bacterium]
MKIAVGIEYNGHGLYGWQAQDNLPTIEGCLTTAISRVANHPIKLFCAGRTDAGVHAKQQVAHFETDATRDPRAWVQGVNSHLPENIAVLWAKTVDEHFHARFSATARRYQYIIYNTTARPALLAHRVTWQFDDLNIGTMQSAANYLLGEQDFTSLRSSACESLSPMRNVTHVSVVRHDDFVVIEIEANAFLHHMVRNIAGVLIRIGRGFAEPEWMKEVLDAKDRKMAAETAPPSGLYLVKVSYPNLYNFPERAFSYFL